MSALNTMTNSQKQSLYNTLNRAHKNGTISEEGEKLLMALAFGTEYIKSKDKGRLREYK